MRPGSTSESTFAPELASGTSDDVVAAGAVNVPLPLSVFASMVTVGLGKDALALDSETRTAASVACGCVCGEIEFDVEVESSSGLSEGSVGLEASPLPDIDGTAGDCILWVDIVGCLKESSVRVTRLPSGTVSSPSIFSRPSCPSSCLPEVFPSPFPVLSPSVVFCRR